MADRTFLPVRSDIVFRMFFGDKRNTEFLISFLKSVLRISEGDYETIEVTNPYLAKDYPDDKLGIVDVKLRTKYGKIIHIEIQLQILPELKARLIFYGAKLITEQIGIGDKYADIQKVISIIITEETLVTDSPRYHHRFTFYDPDAGVEFSDLQEINTLELDKLPNASDGTELYDWAKFIAADTEEELTMAAESNPQIGKATLILRELSADERARDLYERRERERMDEISRIDGARNEEKREIAKNLLGDLPIETIAARTGLTVTEVEELKRQGN